MSLKEKIKETLEWVGHVYTLISVLVALVGGTVVRALLAEYKVIPNVWITPIWLTVAAIVLFAITRFAKPKRDQAQVLTSQAKTAVPAVQNFPPFNWSEFFRLSYKSELTEEAERNILAVARSQPQGQERFLAKVIGIGSISYLYDDVWAYIYKSQIQALMEITRNNGIMTVSAVRSFYDDAAKACPDIYKNFQFESWLEFMRQKQLVIIHPSQMLEITVRGKDFLKYLTHRGLRPDDRRC